jgi:hypothetical protein
MRVWDKVPEISMLVVFLMSLLTANSTLAAGSRYTYYLNGPIARVNSTSLQSVSLAAVPGVAFSNFQHIEDTVFFRGNSSVSYQTDNTTNTTVQVWLCTDVEEGGPSWGNFDFNWSIMDNSTNYPSGIVVASSNFTANLTADWTLISDSAPTKNMFINSTDTMQFAIQCTSTSVSLAFAPGWWLSSNSSQSTDISSINIPMLQQSSVPEMSFGAMVAAVGTMTVLVAYCGNQKLKKRKIISASATQRMPNL